MYYFQILHGCCIKAGCGIHSSFIEDMMLITLIWPNSLDLAYLFQNKFVSDPCGDLNVLKVLMSQCFDYDTFLEINERRPAWRCPCCNCCITWLDLRVDRQMEKVCITLRASLMAFETNDVSNQKVLELAWFIKFSMVPFD